jgi:acyl-CoA thioester hydrolase
MQPFTSAARVHDSDTDQMGFVHHSNYLKYYETARWSFLRHLEIPYKVIEQKGSIACNKRSNTIFKTGFLRREAINRDLHGCIVRCKIDV